jgi:hypothetical protein
MEVSIRIVIWVVILCSLVNIVSNKPLLSG